MAHPALLPSCPPANLPDPLLSLCRDRVQLLDAAKGMLYLHRRPSPIIHRDLKSPNLVSSGEGMLADLGVFLAPKGPP